ncbi:MAG TPA: VWA domain-containing protein [Sandaracinaceae bacterium LLY-WYZ-13_1]|nr:VWA domain-containing protein [Sandaracinaceae bacterium LLY-WYZ-13_1]
MRRLPVGCAVLLLAGCGGLRLSMVDSAYQRPSNVAVYFTVDTAGGDPVVGLEADDFHIYEDGRLVSVNESQQTIVNPEVAAEHYTLLLVDMSGSVSESDQVPMIESAAQQFTSQLEEHQKVAVYAFDGSEDIHRITPFTRSAGAANAGVGRVSGFRARDPSTNLHGAVVNAIDELDTALERSDAPLRFGTVVVFTDGTDRAARVSAQEMGDAIEESPYDFFAIGVGDEIDEGVLGDVGREGYVMVDDPGAIGAAFERVGERILRMTQRYYLLSYCSPARAGEHTVTVEAVTDDASGSLSYDFDAEGFGPNCNPERPPPFDTSQGGATPRSRGRRDRGRRIEVSASVEVE